MNDMAYVLTYLCNQDSTIQIIIGVHLHTQTHWTPLMDAIYAVINGVFIWNPLMDAINGRH
jgi:hypothetical protein